jgi:phage tail-like protein
MRRDDWLVNQLPMGMLEDDFFARFVGIFQTVSSTMLDGVDNLDNVVDVTVAPESVVRWMGSWLGVEAIDSSLAHELQRRIVRECGKILAWRGTKRGLIGLLELMSGSPATVEESGGVYPEGTSPRGAPFVRMSVESTGWVSEEDFVKLASGELPAHVSFELYVGDRRVWPRAPEHTEPDGPLDPKGVPA